MPKGAARHLAGSWNVAEEFDPVRIGRFRRIEFLKRSLDRVEHRLERNMTSKAGPAVRMQVPNGCTHLIIGEPGDVLHQEIDDSRIALKDAEKLESAITRLGDLDRRRHRFRLFVAELERNVFRKRAAEEDAEEAAKCR